MSLSAKADSAVVRNFRLAGLLWLAGGLGACDGRAAAPPPPAIQPAGQAWNWMDFPRADRLSLAQVSASIEPARIEWIKAPHEGWFELAPGLRGGKDQDEAVAAHQILGQMAPGTESLDEAGEALRLELNEVEAQLRQVREEEAVESFLEQERKARQEITLYEAALALADDPALRRDLVPQADQASREEINRLKERLQAAKKRLEKNRAAGERQAALQKRQEALAQSKAAFERRQKTERDQIKASFAGLVRFVPLFEPVPAAGAAQPAASGAPAPSAALRAYVRAEAMLGVLRDHSAFWAKVELADASLLSVPADQLLFAFASGPQTVEAAFGGRAPEGVGGAARMAPVYQFGIETPTPDIVRLAGGVVNGRLVQKLPQAAYIVPKVRLIIHRSDAFADGAWEKNCARVFPGCRVLAVGRDTVALVPPAEQKPDAAPDAAPAAAPAATRVEGGK